MMATLEFTDKQLLRLECILYNEYQECKEHYESCRTKYNIVNNAFIISEESIDDARDSMVAAKKELQEIEAMHKKIRTVYKKRS